MPLERTDMQLILFDPSRDAEVGAESAGAGSTQRIDLGGEWDFRLEPLLDNRFGDYQWPGTDEKIGACIYDAEYERLGGEARKGRGRFTFGERFMLLGAVPASVDERTVLDNLPGTASGVEAAGVRYEWRPYAFSWRWGVEGDFGHQGWHGLKAEMYDDFIRLGATERAFNGMVRKAEASGMKDYYLYTCVDAPRDGLYDAEWGGIRPVGFYVGGERREPAAQVVLKKGINEIVLHYDSFGTARFALRDGKADIAPETLAEAPLRMKFRGDRALEISRAEDGGHAGAVHLHGGARAGGAGIHGLWPETRSACRWPEMPGRRGRTPQRRRRDLPCRVAPACQASGGGVADAYRRARVCRRCGDRRPCEAGLRGGTLYGRRLVP